MRVVAVAILAGVGLSACGLGADEDPSGAVVGAASQGLTQSAPVAPPAGPQGQPREETGNPSGSGPVDPAAVGIPQDPIPLWQGKGPAAAVTTR